jgi:hypothetical protein
MNGNFGVTTEGKLYARGAEVYGSIYAEKGQIGDILLEDGQLKIKQLYISNGATPPVYTAYTPTSKTYVSDITINQVYRNMPVEVTNTFLSTTTFQVMYLYVSSTAPTVQSFNVETEGGVAATIRNHFNRANTSTVVGT